MTSPVEIKIEIPGRPYSVWIGAGILERAGEFLPLSERVDVAMLAADETALTLYGERASAGLEATCVRVERESIEGGEAAKTMSRAESLLRRLTAAGAHRRDLLVALGGGATGDLVGFVAATYHRGMPFAQMPTTLLAQVDASIGGKTGVNLPEGKNLVGAYHQPVAVISDVTTLQSLPGGEFSSGLAEVVKHGLIDDADLLSLLQRERAAIFDREPMSLVRLVSQAASIKARIVAADETEQGRRAFLNYGHTLGHALEALGGYSTWRHGEAVAIGMMFAAHLAAGLGFADRVAEHARAVEAAGLPVAGAEAPFESVLRAMGGDKKYHGGIRFVILEDLGRPRLVSDVSTDLVRSAYEKVSA
ncbi:MAG: 3-dehydroquinate synthase [Actinomycetota bacterium]|nr:3-dehydroquinate synthase [Actinomycetota bacterium]